MILQNLLLVLPAGVLSTITKIARTKLNEETVKYISENGMYHFTSNEETANKIIESGNIRPSKSAIVSYGIPAAFLFAGLPDKDNYLKNLAGGSWNNLLLHPEQILYAVKIDAKENELSNYKMRLQDGAIIAEGGAIIKPEQCSVKEVVIDYLSDKTGKKVLQLRERTKEEMEKDNDIIMMGDTPVHFPGGKIHKYTPSKECLEAIEREKQRLGYISSLGLVSTISDVVGIENRESINAIKNVANKVKNLFARLKNGDIKLLGEAKDKKQAEISELKVLNPDEEKLTKLSNIVNGISNGTLKNTRPISTKTYQKSILEFNKQGIYQKDLAKTFNELLNSSFYQYAKKKENSINQNLIYKSKTHGINHSRKVAILCSEILQSTGINFDEKMVDILMTASYYHDIGRIADIGPHALNSVRKLKNVDLTFENGEKYSENDRNILYALVDCHEGKDSEIDKKLEKYNISEEDKTKVKFYAEVLRDADALDRARISTSFLMDLNPQYLRLNESKKLINFSFDLDNISNLIPTKDLMSLDVMHNKEKSFLDSLKVETNPQAALNKFNSQEQTQEKDSIDRI